MTPTAYGLQTVTKPGGGAPVLGSLFGFYWPTGGDLEVWEYDSTGTYVGLVNTFAAAPWTPAGGGGGADPGFGIRDRCVFMHSDPTSTVGGPVLVWREPAQNVIAMYDLASNSLATVVEKHGDLAGASVPTYILCANQGDGFIYQVGSEQGVGAVDKFMRKFKADGSSDTVSKDTTPSGRPCCVFGEFTFGGISQRAVSTAGIWRSPVSVTGTMPTDAEHHYAAIDQGAGPQPLGYSTSKVSLKRLRHGSGDFTGSDNWGLSNLQQSGAAVPASEQNAHISVNAAGDAGSFYPFATPSPTELLWQRPGFSSTANSPRIGIARKDNAPSGTLYPHLMHPNTISITFP